MRYLIGYLSSTLEISGESVITTTSLKILKFSRFVNVLTIRGIPPIFFNIFFSSRVDSSLAGIKAMIDTVQK